MGKYVNPPSEEKEAWLEKNAIKVTKERFLTEDYDLVTSQGGNYIVLIDNYIFTAAMVCFCKSEYEYVKEMMKTDERPLRFYLANIEATNKVAG